MVAFIEQQLTNNNYGYDVAVFNGAATSNDTKVTVNGTQMSLSSLLWSPAGTGRYRGYYM